MKYCRTVSGLVKARQKGEVAYLKYTAIFRDRQRGVYEIFLLNGKKEVVKDEIYNRISGYLVEVY